MPSPEHPSLRLPIPRFGLGFVERALRDRRDVPMLLAIGKCLLWVLVVPPTLFLIHRIPLWLPPLYLIGLFYLMPPYILALHFATHRPVFQPGARWITLLMRWGIGPFFGQTPGTYECHHVGMHHRENNLWDDCSSTLKYDRDNPLHFARYVGRFYFLGLFDLCSYFWRRGRTKPFRRALIGELSWLLAFAFLFWLRPVAALTVGIAPVVLSRFMMMAGNWAQHSFISPDRPGDAFGNSITCIEHPYNRRCFNDGYHTAHHLRPAQHWSELPQSFEQERSLYAKEEAVVFSGVDFFGVWVLLMLKNYGRLADRLVGPGAERLPRDQAIALLRARTRRFVKKAA